MGSAGPGSKDVILFSNFYQVFSVIDHTFYELTVGHKSRGIIQPFLVHQMLCSLSDALPLGVVQPLAFAHLGA